MQTCPKGHNSTEADFCSECGSKIGGLGIAAPTSNPVHSNAATKAGSTSCPDCSTPHEADSGNFCEICGYNFLTGAQGGDPLSIFPLSIKSSGGITTAPTQLPTPNPLELDAPITGNEQLAPKVAAGSQNNEVVAASAKLSPRWELVISIDPSLATPDSPIAPTQAPITIQLNHPTNLIGRTSQARAIHPEIPLDFDDAVSSRHAILTLHPDGSLVLRDIGSSNGTMVNGKEIAIMSDISISSGDEIALGHWTRIKLMNLNSG
jgi:FHA domain